jgi:hypothetical protein
MSITDRKNACGNKYSISMIAQVTVAGDGGLF